MACSLDVLGDRWTLLIVRDLMLGKKYFKEFMASPERISSNILSDRLQKLLEAGIVVTRSSVDHQGRNAYRLTEKGGALLPVLEAMRDWGLANIADTSVQLTVVAEGD